MLSIHPDRDDLSVPERVEARTRQLDLDPAPLAPRMDAVRDDHRLAEVDELERLGAELVPNLVEVRGEAAVPSWPS